MMEAAELDAIVEAVADRCSDYETDLLKTVAAGIASLDSLEPSAIASKGLEVRRKVGRIAARHSHVIRKAVDDGFTAIMTEDAASEVLNASRG